MSFENELTETLNDGLAEIKGEQTKLQKKFADVDTVMKKIEAETQKNGKASEDTKEQYLKQVDKVVNIEKSLDALIEKQEKMTKAGNVVKTAGSVAAENLKNINYSGGNMTLAEAELSLFGKSVSSGAGSAGSFIEPDR